MRACCVFCVILSVSVRRHEHPHTPTRSFFDTISRDTDIQTQRVPRHELRKQERDTFGTTWAGRPDGLRRGRRGGHASARHTNATVLSLGEEQGPPGQQRPVFAGKRGLAGEVRRGYYASNGQYVRGRGGPRRGGAGGGGSGLAGAVLPHLQSEL